MSSKHLVAVATKLESFRQAGKRVKELLASILGDEEDRRDFLVEDYAAAKEYKDDFASRTAVIAIDARQTRTLITPERRDKNVDHWDELRTLTDSFTLPKGAVLVVIYGDERSRQLEDDALISKEWMATWKYNDGIAYDLAARKRCFTVWDSFNKAQTDRLREYFKTAIPLYKFYETRLNQCFVHKTFLQLVFQKITNSVFSVPLKQTVLLITTDDVPENFNHYLHLNPFVTSIEDKTGNISKYTVITYKVVNFVGLSKREAIKVYQVRLSTECIQHHGEAQLNTVDELHNLAHDLATYRFTEAMPRIMRIIVSFIPTPILRFIWRLLGQLGIGPLTYDALAQVTHCKDCFVHKVDANGDNSKVIGKSGVGFHGEVIPVVQDTQSSSDKVITKVNESCPTMAVRSKTNLERRTPDMTTSRKPTRDKRMPGFLHALVALFLLLLTSPRQAVAECYSIIQRVANYNFLSLILNTITETVAKLSNTIKSIRDFSIVKCCISIIIQVFFVIHYVFVIMITLLTLIFQALKIPCKKSGFAKVE
ncbi:uncharacterized protein [Ptychodera flava]|uniref:uncharacterized protein n=1 Tax=Ptychodera flava TaxID=63121 RepID=UPI003969E090